jgi:hypothetical protein
MKSFIFTITEGRTPRDGSGTPKTVRVYQIIKNEPQYMGDMTDTFVSDFQLFMRCAEFYKWLPKSAFIRSESSGGYKYGSAWTIREAGVAKVRQVC